MSNYPTETIPTANGVQSYMAAPEGAAAAFATAQAEVSPIVRIVGAFDALRGHVEVLDAEGLKVLASCAEQIVLYGFHGKSVEALPVRDAAKARLAALTPPPPPPEGE